MVMTNTPAPENSVAIDTVAAVLPAETKAAQKELTKARTAMTKLRPNGPYIVINTHTNKIDLRTEDTILFEATCSTGHGGMFVDSTTGRKWVFNTPDGVFKINSKIKQPWWRKPDWAFLEDDEKIPKNENERYDPQMMGDYAMGFGDGYFIHGTIYERLLGISVTHGCVRVGSDDLKELYDKVKIGTYVYIF
jgi:L,D-transpeptidase YbiS